MKYSIIYIFILLMISCSSNKEIQSKEVVYYGKSACLGKCPVFDFYAYSNGKIIYKGIKNVAKKGTHTFTISKDKLEKIQNEVMKLQHHNNSKPVRDFPNTIIKISGKKIAIQNSINTKSLDKLIQEIILSI